MGGVILAGRLSTGWLLDRYFAPSVAAGLFAISALGMFLLAGARSIPVGIEPPGSSVLGWAEKAMSLRICFPDTSASGRSRLYTASRGPRMPSPAQWALS